MRQHGRWVGWVLIIGVVLWGCAESAPESVPSDPSSTSTGSDTAPSTSTETGPSTSPSSTTIVAPGRSAVLDTAVEQLFVSACVEHAAEASTATCSEFLDQGWQLVVANSCDSSTILAITERLVMSGFTTDVAPGTFHTCAPSLSDLLITDPLSGFVPLPPGAPEVGVLDLDQLADLFASNSDLARRDLERFGILASVSTHLVRGDITQESLVIRLDLFETRQGLEAWTAPAASPVPDTISIEVPEVEIGRVTTSVQTDDPSLGDDRSLGVQRLGYGRSCLTAVTVFYRAATDNVPAEEIADLLIEQALVVEANCAELEASVS